MNQPKRHHYVPDMLLKRFVDDDGWLHCCWRGTDPFRGRPKRRKARRINSKPEILQDFRDLCWNEPEFWRFPASALPHSNSQSRLSVIKLTTALDSRTLKWFKFTEPGYARTCR